MDLLKRENGQENAGGQESAGRSFGWKEYLVYYLGYTLLFALTAAVVFVWFFLKRRRMIWEADGVGRNYYGLLYFSRWGKEVLRNFRETGSLKIPTFTLRMGYGEDLYTSLAYYLIGDPFSLAAVFVPEKFLLFFNDLMLMVRLWLAGITFSAYNFYMGRKSRIGVLAGALVYIFNGFTLTGMQYHYFLNPFVFFPLLLIGCERYFRKKKPLLFLLMAFVTAVSNVSFLRLMVSMTALYVVWRSVRLRGLRHFGGVILDVIAFVWYGLIGILLSAFVLLPAFLQSVQDPGTAGAEQIQLLWPPDWYRNFIDSFLTNGTSALAESWTCMGFGAVAALCVLFLFVQRKKHFDLKAAFVILTAFLMTPAAGFVLNGFSYAGSYPDNRWMWVYALLVGCMTAAAVPELAEAGARKLGAALILLVITVGVCVVWKYTFSGASAIAVIIALIGLAAVLLGRAALLEKERETLLYDAGAETKIEKHRIDVRGQAVLAVCVILTIALGAYFDFAPSQNAKASGYLSRAEIETSAAGDAKAASELIDGQLLKDEADESGRVPFYRYTAFDPKNNTSLLYGVSNTQISRGLTNAVVRQFNDETGQPDRSADMDGSLDDRTFLNAIAGVRYYLGSDAEGIPYGYEKKEGLSYSNEDLWPDHETLERYSCEVYENQYALPTGFTTDKWISRQDYDAMDIPERQQALMQGIVLETDPGEGYTRLNYSSSEKTGAGTTAGTGENKLLFTDTAVPVLIEYDGKEVPVEDGKGISFKAAKKGGTVTIRFAGFPGRETGLYIRGLHYDAPANSTKSANSPKNESSKSSGSGNSSVAGNSEMLIGVTGFAGAETAASRKIRYSTQDDTQSADRNDYYVNMCCNSKSLDRIEITLPAKGTYSFDAIEVVCQTMVGYAQQAEALRAFPLEDLDIHEMGESSATEQITGHVDLETPQILCIQIPCTAGWTAYVDGTRAQLLQADTMFSALLLPGGSHEIELRYQTPGLRFGAAVSAGALVLLALFCLIYAIVSAILRGRRKRLEAIPVGTFEKAEGPVQAAGMSEEAEGPVQAAGMSEETEGSVQAAGISEEAEGSVQAAGMSEEAARDAES